MKRSLFIPLFVLAPMAVMAQGVMPAEAAAEGSSTLDLAKIFYDSPIIYVTLGLLSITSLAIWLYSLLTLKQEGLMPRDFMDQVSQEIRQGRFEAALVTCRERSSFSAQVIASGLEARKHGAHVVLDSMHAEGKRLAGVLWQRISLLSDIAAIAPMLGLLGTVLGMFYAFYDANRTVDTISSLFDGLGIAIGTTVAGLLVAIVATIFHSSLRFRAVNLLNSVENQAISLGNAIESGEEH